MLTKQELRQLQPKEINEELTRSSRELIKARMEHSTQTLKETHRLQLLKKHIAIIKTIANETKKASAPKKKTASKKKQ